MVKSKLVYECSNCGARFSKWQGQCSSCLAWNSISEVLLQLDKKPGVVAVEALRLNEVQLQDSFRQKAFIGELDRVLGGGFTLGSVTLLSGDPGIGKSTLLLQTAAQLAKEAVVLYVSAEESVQQTALRAHRLNLDKNNQNLALLAEVNLDKILASAEKLEAKFLIVDSIQTVYLEQLDSSAGSVSQVRECASLLTRFAKSKAVTVIMVGHVTKEGNVAGPRVLEHLVDTVIYFEGEQHSNFRILRSTKNRFGSVGEIGVFNMQEKGLLEVNNPSSLFLSSYRSDIAGSCIVVAQEGSRPLLVEVQALIDKSYGSFPKRVAVGFDSFRLSMLIAIAQRHLNLSLYDRDIFLNMVGGLKVNEPAADLAVILAIISSYRNKILPYKLAAFGEIGLSGEVRAVQKAQERLKEALKLGFEKVLCPKLNLTKNTPSEVLGVATLQEAVKSCNL